MDTVKKVVDTAVKKVDSLKKDSLGAPVTKRPIVPGS